MTPRRRSPSSRMALVRARLELPTIRRAVGHSEGQHASMFTGHGIDFEDQVEYRPGDDVSSIDWKSSARAGHPIIRRFERESDVFTQLVLDMGVEMLASAPSGERKSEIALWAADVLAYLGSSRGDRLGLVWGDRDMNQALPARHGHDHLEFLLNRAAQAYEEATAPADVSGLLERVLTLTRLRTLIVLVTDEAWPTKDDLDTLRKVRARHELLVVRVADMPMTVKGVDRMIDINEGVVLPAFAREDPELARMLFQYRQTTINEAHQLLRGLGITQTVVNSSDEVVPFLVDMLRRGTRD
ncbi:MAG: DUF58 domain-containing protein [Flaviflexus sp.]|uniref:DUF58 domain-containing protein n=1 Tax=Flaviflexus sp. TaxID=1969482 RepID=UPI00352CCD4E